MRSDAQMIPEIAAENAITLPKQDPGQQSPYPIVPIVIIIHQTKSLKDKKLGLLLSAKLNILENTITKETQKMTRECSGYVLKNDLGPNELESLVLQMRHILLALVEQQRDELIIESYKRYILPSIIIYRMVLTSRGIYYWKMGQVTWITIFSQKIFGWISNISSQIQILLMQWIQGFSLLRRISCFNLRSICFLYLTSTNRERLRLIAECNINIAVLLPSFKFKKTCRRDSSMDVNAR